MATIQYVVNAVDGASTTFAKIALSAEGLSADLDKLAKRDISIPVDLAGDKELKLSAAQITVQLDRLNRKVANPKITPEGLAAAQLGIMRLDLAMDRLDKKRVKLHVEGAGATGLLSRLGFLFAGGGSGALPAAGSAAAGGMSLGSTALLAGGAAAFAALGAGAGGIVPLLAAATLGLGSFAALAMPTIKDLTAGMTALSAASDNYAAASGNLNIAIHQSPADLAAYQSVMKGLEPDLANAAKLLTNQGIQWQNLTPVQQRSAVALFNNAAAYKTLLPSQKTALTALLAEKKAWDAMSPGQQAAARGISGLASAFGTLSDKMAPITFKVIDDGLSILRHLLPDLLPLAKTAGNAIDGLLKGFDKFVTPTPASSLHGKLAAVSGPMPAPTGFQQFMTQMTQQAGPAITAIGQGIGRVVIAVGKLLVALTNPNGLRAIKATFDTIEWIIQGLAWVITKVTPNIIGHFHDIAVGFDAVRRFFAVAGHDIAITFDFLRHSSASTGHDIAHTFDVMRHDVAATWDLLWRNTVGRVQRGVADVEHWFNGLPGGVKNALSGLGRMLLGVATGSMSDLWNGFKSVGGQILSWFGGFIKSIVGFFKNLLGIHSPSSVFFDLGKQIMMGLAAGIKAHANAAASAVKSAAAGAIAPAAGAAASGSVAALAQRMAAGRGWIGAQWNALNAVEMAEAGWNLRAVNPGSGAYGIAQFINGPSEYYQYGGNPNTAVGQVTGFLNYIAQRYGSPSAAWAHEQAYHWYGSGLAGGIFNRPTLIGVGERGPERVDVTPLGSGGGNVEGLLRQLIDEVRALAPRTGAAVSAGVSGGTRGAGRAAYYATRGR